MTGRLWISTIALLLLLAQASGAAERIESFHSRIEIHPDGSITVTEEIAVNVEHQAIRRGIFRDYPTRYRHPLGHMQTTGFQVLEILRNGEPEPWHSEDRPNGLRIYVGRADVLVPAGRQLYSLRYRSTRQLGFFQDHDELYWNVTGNGWEFPILEAVAEVVLPPGVPIQPSLAPGPELVPPASTVEAPLRIAAYTGADGARGRAWSTEPTADGVRLVTTAPLGRFEGLTIAVGWPKGHVEEPGRATRLRWLATDNPGLAAGPAGAALLLAYFVTAWWRVGRDPVRGVIFPHFEPPAGLSPAAMRYILRRRFDDRGFTAAVLDMAVKGVLRIHQGPKYVSLVRTAPVDDNPALSDDEKGLATELLGSRERLTLDHRHRGVLSRARDGLRTSLRTAYKGVLFHHNRAWMWPGLALAAVVLLTMVLLDPAALGPALMIGGFLTAWAWFAFNSWRAGNRLQAAALAATVVALATAMALVAREVLLPLPLLVALLPFALCLAFYRLLEAPTPEGRRIVDQIEGFRQYLSVAERERLEYLHPPEDTPELFDRYLPHAFALDVEQQWTRRFEGVLRAAGIEPGAPAWYRGPADRPLNAPAVGRTVSGAISSASRAPGSRSGSSGGGRSGGGGGGGGGGGW